MKQLSNIRKFYQLTEETMDLVRGGRNNMTTSDISRIHLENEITLAI